MRRPNLIGSPLRTESESLNENYFLSPAVVDIIKNRWDHRSDQVRRWRERSAILFFLSCQPTAGLTKPAMALCKSPFRPIDMEPPRYGFHVGGKMRCNGSEFRLLVARKPFYYAASKVALHCAGPLAQHSQRTGGRSDSELSYGRKEESDKINSMRKAVDKSSDPLRTPELYSNGKRIYLTRLRVRLQ